MDADDKEVDITVAFQGRAGYLKVFTNAMGSYHMSSAVEFT
jgi:hypothetical protein